MKIETLTDEQLAYIPILRKEWLDRASRPIDKDRASAAIAAVYQYIGCQTPRFVFVDSPIKGLLAIDAMGKKSLGDSLWDSLRASLWASLGDSLRVSLGDSLRASLGDSLRASLRDSLRASLWDSLGDSLRVSLGDSLGPESLQADSALFEYCRFLGIEFPEKEYELYLNFCKEAYWIFPYTDVVVVCNRPQVRWSESDTPVIHCEDGPAIEFKDGLNVWAIEGVRVDEQIVMRPETQTIEQINREKNEEIKRVRISRFGWQRYLEEGNASVLDVNLAIKLLP